MEAAGHTVTTPDLYEGALFSSLEAGVEHLEAIGLDEVVARGCGAVAGLPARLVYAGITLGMMPAQRLAQTRPGASGAIFRTWWTRAGRSVDGPYRRPTPLSDGEVIRNNVVADIGFYVGLAREAEGPIVEMAIGSGRVAVPIALATGRPVIGVDTSPAMLDVARCRADEAGVDLILHLGDMADLQLDEPAALIICPFRALLHVPTWSARRRVFERVAAALSPGGRFAWNAFAFDHHVAARTDGVRVVDGEHAHTDHFSVGDNRVDIILDDGATSSLWWATKNEWLGLIDVAGLEIEALYGDFASTPFQDDSGEYVFVTRHPAT